MIDNLEHGGDSIPTVNGRCGTWFTYNDGSASQTPASTMVFPSMPGYCSNNAMNTAGGPFTQYGGGIGLDLNSCASGPRKTYNAQQYNYKGIAFMAKSSTAATAGGVDFLVLEPATVAQGGNGGGTCVPNDAGGTCGDSHQYPFTLTTEWQEYHVLFTDLVQVGWGVPVGPLDPTQILAMQFNIGINEAFNFWVDDIGFY